VGFSYTIETSKIERAYLKLELSFNTFMVSARNRVVLELQKIGFSLGFSISSDVCNS
jgi:hypothetical protein